MKPVPIMEFEIAASAVAVDSVAQRMDAWLTESRLDPHRFPIAMLLRESLNNAMLHGCRDNPAGPIRCRCELQPPWLRLEVWDPGPGFDWAERLACVADDSLCHGRGLQIYRLYADRIEFNPMGNHVSLWRRISGGDEP